ncbi:MAG: lipo-like protein [Burkholderiales bacterium]|nr:lipo-like protein [Burkholderiales bacterium]
MNASLSFFGRRLARYLTAPSRNAPTVTTNDPVALASALRPGDVLLVEGHSRVSSAIKYLTQSTWSHSALYVGNALGPPPDGEEPRVLVEADLSEGVRGVPLSLYAERHTRICRPVGLAPDDLRQVIDYAVARIGHQYDLRHLIDLARYLMPTPPVPSRWRRRMIALGSGDPTRAICSTLIAQAFDKVRYPILPVVVREPVNDDPATFREILHIRHHSLYAPRDFDISPYFRIVKPTLEAGFDYRKLHWAEETPA